jgi:predicted nucleotide-binding protein (sugar kinase/HSP70/actin superfamily)
MNCVINPTGTLLPTFEEAVTQLKAAERMKLLEAAGLIEKPVEHFHRPPERPFTVEERDQVTILFGGFTWKHERFIEAILKGSGYRCQMLPNPDVAAFTIGKEYGNNGQCNPTYFTIGNLIKYLQSLESQGISRREIVDRYIFFTAGSCGPCRFGMYESEYRLALDNAGFEDFRILLYQADQAIKTASDNPGLNFTLDFNLGALNMLNLGDVINDMVYQIRPYEVVPGATDEAIEEIVSQLSSFLETRKRYEILERTPGWVSRFVARNKKLNGTLNTAGKILDHLYSEEFVSRMHLARRRLNQIEVDHTRVKPVVKIVGEFWAQLQNVLLS